MALIVEIFLNLVGVPMTITIETTLLSSVAIGMADIISKIFVS